MTNSSLNPWCRSLLLVVLLTGATSTASGADRPVVGDPIPRSEVHAEDGAILALIPETPVVQVLLFLHRSQVYSQDALGDLASLMEQLPDPKPVVRVIWVAVDPEGHPIQDFPGVTQCFDPERKAAHAFGVIAFPTTVITTRDRKVGTYLPSHPPNYSRVIDADLRLHLGLIDEAEYQRRTDSAGPSGTQNSTGNRARLLASFALRLVSDGQLMKARENFEKALGLAPEDPEVVAAFLELLLLENNLDEARKRVDAALQRDPMHAQLRFISAQLLLREEKPTEARKVLEELLPLYPQRSRVHFALGQIAERAEEWKGAARHYRKAAEALREKHGG